MSSTTIALTFPRHFRPLLITTLVSFLFTSQAFARGQAPANYYDADIVEEFEGGNKSDKDLHRLAGDASGKSFRGLGYKRGSKPALFGDVDLKSDSEGYYVKDVYCNFMIRDKVGPSKQPKNNVMNVEHTWPQSKGAKREPARGDLHHLFPTDSRANSTRGNHPFGEVEGEDATDGCPISQKGKIINPNTGNRTSTHGFQPPKEHRGNVARAMFYVSARYGYRISDLEEYYLRKWHNDDPVDSEEIARNDAVQENQGNRNPFIDFPQIVERISDF